LQNCSGASFVKDAHFARQLDSPTALQSAHLNLDFFDPSLNQISCFASPRGASLQKQQQRYLHQHQYQQHKMNIKLQQRQQQQKQQTMTKLKQGGDISEYKTKKNQFSLSWCLISIDRKALEWKPIFFPRS
jgi:hypothetical protein